MWAYLFLRLLLAKACLANASIQIRVAVVTAKGLIRILFSAGQCTECCQCQAENTHTQVGLELLLLAPEGKKEGTESPCVSFQELINIRAFSQCWEILSYEIW